MEQAERSETSAHKFQTPGVHPKESIQHTEQGESLTPGIKQHVITKGDYPGV